jgi:hypothetical protein
MVGSGGNIWPLFAFFKKEMYNTIKMLGRLWLCLCIGGLSMDYDDNFDNGYECDPVESGKGFRKGKGRARNKNSAFYH